MKKFSVFLLGLVLIIGLTSQATATLIVGPDIIGAPSSVIDDPPGATNDHQQAFNEAQGITLLAALSVDGGSIAAGTTVDSHMIFLNTIGSTRAEDTQVWGFDGIILGVMSDGGGLLEAASNAILGASGTSYPGAFGARGLESNDAYAVSGNLIKVAMVVTEPGDWIRVVTASVPEPGTMLLLGIGLIGLAGLGRRKFIKK